MDEEIRKIAESINNKIEKLNKTLDSNCWLCHTSVRNWVCLFPKNGIDDLGFGSNDNKTRMAFVPLCDDHDISDQDIIEELQRILVIKNQMLKN